MMLQFHLMMQYDHEYNRKYLYLNKLRSKTNEKLLRYSLTMLHLL